MGRWINRNRRVGEVELDDEGTEEDVAEQDAHEGGGGGLDARAVVRIQPPFLERNFKAEASHCYLPILGSHIIAARMPPVLCVTSIGRRRVLA